MNNVLKVYQILTIKRPNFQDGLQMPTSYKIKFGVYRYVFSVIEYIKNS